jgi:hypothetical protein
MIIAASIRLVSDAVAGPFLAQMPALAALAPKDGASLPRRAQACADRMLMKPAQIAKVRR